jgi:hypothetical protein
MACLTACIDGGRWWWSLANESSTGQRHQHRQGLLSHGHRAAITTSAISSLVDHLRACTLALPGTLMYGTKLG